VLKVIRLIEVGESCVERANINGWQMLQQFTDILATFVNVNSFGEMGKKRLTPLLLIKGYASIWGVGKQRLHGFGREEKSIARNQQNPLLKSFK